MNLSFLLFVFGAFMVLVSAVSLLVALASARYKNSNRERNLGIVSVICTCISAAIYYHQRFIMSGGSFSDPRVVGIIVIYAIMVICGALIILHSQKSIKVK